MHRALRALHDAAEDFAHHLMAEADAENGELAGIIAHDGDGLARFGGRAGAGRDDDGLCGAQVLRRHLVVSHDPRALAQFLEIARHVVNEAVIIVDDEDHGRNASMMRLILVRLSSYSAAGCERAVMPPPPCTRATPPWNCAVRMAMLRSVRPLKPI